jgi:hypothetical protein
MFMMLLQFGLACLLGLAGNTWRITRLKKRGFQHLKTIEADTPHAAIAVVTNSSESVAQQPSTSGK